MATPMPRRRRFAGRPLGGPVPLLLACAVVAGVATSALDRHAVVRAGDGVLRPVSTEGAEAAEGGETASANAAEDEKLQRMTRTQRIYYTTTPVTRFETHEGLDRLVTLPTGKGNAADHYHRLEMLYPQDREGPDQIAIKLNSKGIREIFAGVRMADCSLTPAYYPYMTTARVKMPDVIVLTAYGDGLLRLAAEFEKRGDPKNADQVFQCAIIFGHHLAKDRSNLLSFQVGISLMGKAAREYARFLQRRMDLTKNRAALEFVDRLGRVQAAVRRKSQIQMGDFTNFNCLPALIKVAKLDADPMWRQEAVVRLGVLRLGAPDRDFKTVHNDPKQQELAERALLDIANSDPLPWMRKLATWTIKNVTPQNFTGLRSFSRQVESRPATSVHDK